MPPPARTPRRAAADLQISQFRLRRGTLKVRDKVRVMTNHRMKLVQRVGGESVHLFTPLRLRHRRRAQRRLQHGSDVRLQGLGGHARQTELGLDHLPLLGDAHRTVDRTRRLRANRFRSRTATPSHGAATTVKQRQRNGVAPEHLNQLFLRLIEAPARRHLAGILGRIGITDHHLLAAIGIVLVPVDRKQGVHTRCRALQCVQALEQRHDSQRTRDPEFLLQQRHGGHIGRGARHRYHVSAKRLVVFDRQHAKRVQHIGDCLVRLVCTGKTGSQQRAAISQFRNQKSLTLLFIPLGVATQFEMPGDGIQRLGVSLGFLSNIQLQQRQTECVQPPHDVRQPSLRNQFIATGDQRAVARFQRLTQLLAIPVNRNVGVFSFESPLRIGYFVGQRQEVLDGRAQSLQNLHQQHTIGFTLIGADSLSQLCAAIPHRQIAPQFVDVLPIQFGRPRTAQNTHLARHGGRDIRVAVAIATHPRSQR